MNISLPLIIIFLSSAIWLFSQFGGHLSAKTSPIWWLIFAFLFVALVSPDTLAPLAYFFKVKVISNLVFSSLIFFLLWQNIEQTWRSTNQERKLRDLISNLAAQDFFFKTTVCENDAETTKNALVILPCFNEAKSIPHVLKDLRKLANYTHVKTHFCFVDDGSNDNSREILKSLCPKNFVQHQSNLGVGGVLLTGFKIGKEGNYDFVVQCDADGQHPIDKIPSLLEEASKRNLDLLIGSRFTKATNSTITSGNSLESTTYARRLGGMTLIKILRLFGASTVINDPTSGFRIYSKKAYSYLISVMPDEYPEPESLALLMLKQFRIEETHVSMKKREYGTSSISKLKSLQYMIKVISALLGLRFRTFFSS